MASRAFDWSNGAQARRIAAADARFTAIDCAYGVLYVLAAFYLELPHAIDAFHQIATPFIVLSLVLFYMTDRICAPENDAATAMFYANLPRRRPLVFWTHVAWLAVFILAMEAVICAAVALRFTAARPDQPFVVGPCMLALPFFCASVCLWYCYVTLSRYIKVPLVIALVFLAAFVGGWGSRVSFVQAKGVPGTFMQHASPVLVLVVVAALLVLHAHRCWTKRQVGEVA